ncbi:type II toxin-antitoxin system RelE/ParE family toxin [Alkanindiges sp. WGS2144]|uniref:type II toxin-antitoxin system RelE/ParE family toxin n=1 Tax=Alkanindiges sp. WGS2144 TaxID=3366808 RepID=UPI0037509F68
MPIPPLTVLFFKTDSGVEPVRQWLKDFSPTDKKSIGEDIRTVQIGWPLGMPLVRKMDTDLWEIRIHILSGIARIFFTVSGNTLLLLHGFVKKSQATPKSDLELAKQRLKQSRRTL